MPAKNFKLFLIWITGGTIAYLLACRPINDFFTEGLIVPYGPDSFYHAKRILYLLDHGVLLQFDPYVNAPYGDIISWPWAYDTLMALVVFIITIILPDSSALSILLNIPPFIVFINVALIIAIAKSLKLSTPYIILAVTCFSLSPLTQELHLLGRIDHHTVEHTLVLSALLFGTRWFIDPTNKRYTVMFGTILGIAPAFHNGLFILQFPLLVTLVFLWLSNKRLPEFSVYFAAALVVSSILTLLPSQAFKTGYFTFYYHSWFHLYAACSSALIFCLLLRNNFNRNNVIILICTCFILTLPLLSDVASGITFVTGESPIFSQLDEIQSPLAIDNEWSLYSMYVIKEYSGLFLILPLSLLMLFIWYRSDRVSYKLYFLIFSVFASVLLLSQLRLNYFGSYVLYLPILLGAMMISARWRNYKIPVLILTTLIVLITYYPSTERLLYKRPLGGSHDYSLTYPIYDEISNYCNTKPGVILAAPNDGHYISFHSDCSVISNVMLISPLDFDRLNETKRLMGLSAEKLLQEEDWIDYIYVRREDSVYNNYDIAKVMQINQGLRAELLFTEDYPPGLSLLAAVNYIDANQDKAILAKLFRIEH